MRIEHPQGVIDRARWGQHAGHPLLGAADYKLVHHAQQQARTVYSFCMCPGGTVVAATSEPGRVVTNGMNSIRATRRNANAGMVVGVTPGLSRTTRCRLQAMLGATHGVETLAADETHPLAGIVLQRQLESAPSRARRRQLHEAPGPARGDFLARRIHRAGRGAAVLSTRRDADRPARPCPPTPPRPCRRPCRLRPQDTRLTWDAVLTGVETHLGTAHRPGGENFRT